MNLFTSYRIRQDENEEFWPESRFLFTSWFRIFDKPHKSLSAAQQTLETWLNKKDKTKIFSVTIKKHSYQSTEKCGTFQEVSIQNK